MKQLKISDSTCYLQKDGRCYKGRYRHGSHWGIVFSHDNAVVEEMTTGLVAFEAAYFKIRGYEQISKGAYDEYALNGGN